LEIWINSHSLSSSIIMYAVLAVFTGLLIAFLLLQYGPWRGSESRDFNNISVNFDNPLPECPDSPNCVRISVKTDFTLDQLIASARKAIEKEGAIEVKEITEKMYIEAVFRIPVFGFKDDVQLQAGESGGSAILSLRSASRTGKNDLGVNRRRVQRLLNHLDLTAE